MMLFQQSLLFHLFIPQPSYAGGAVVNVQYFFLSYSQSSLNLTDDFVFIKKRTSIHGNPHHISMATLTLNFTQKGLVLGLGNCLG